MRKPCFLPNFVNNERSDQFLYPWSPGLPRSGKKVWKMKFFPGQGKVREF